jgi:hypothetical protein
VKCKYVTKVSLNYVIWNLSKICLCYIELDWDLIILTKFDYVTLSLSGNWLCCYNLIRLLYFHLIWLCYIFCIIHHVIVICGVSGWKSDFVVFHIYKVGVWFTSPNEHMHHPFRNDAPYIKLWGASLQNCPAYFGQPENCDQHVLSGYPCSCVSFVRGFDSIILLFSVTPTLGMWS